MDAASSSGEGGDHLRRSKRNKCRLNFRTLAMTSTSPSTSASSSQTPRAAAKKRQTQQQPIVPSSANRSTAGTVATPTTATPMHEIFSAPAALPTRRRHQATPKGAAEVKEKDGADHHPESLKLSSFYPPIVEPTTTTTPATAAAAMTTTPTTTTANNGALVFDGFGVQNQYNGVTATLPDSKKGDPEKKGDEEKKRGRGRRPYGRLNCKDCPFRAKTTRRIERHTAGHERLNGFACPFCTFKSESCGFLKRHIFLHPEAVSQLKSAGTVAKNADNATLLVSHVETASFWPPKYLGKSGGDGDEKTKSKKRNRESLGLDVKKQVAKPQKQQQQQQKKVAAAEEKEQPDTSMAAQPSSSSSSSPADSSNLPAGKKKRKTTDKGVLAGADGAAVAAKARTELTALVSKAALHCHVQNCAQEGKPFKSRLHLLQHKRHAHSVRKTLLAIYGRRDKSGERRFGCLFCGVVPLGGRTGYLLHRLRAHGNGIRLAPMVATVRLRKRRKTTKKREQQPKRETSDEAVKIEPTMTAMTTEHDETDPTAVTYPPSLGAVIYLGPVAENQRQKGLFYCLECPHVTPQRSRHELHAGKHKVVAEQQCPCCTFSCRTLEILVQHVRLHFGTINEDDKGFKLCPLCPFSVRTQESLVQHIRSHFSAPLMVEKTDSEEPAEKRPKIEESDMTMSDVTARTTPSVEGDHESTIDTEGEDEEEEREDDGEEGAQSNGQPPSASSSRPSSNRKGGRYVCHGCPYTTRHLCDLKAHHRMHSGIRPLRCVHCTYSTHRAASLVGHLIIHDSEHEALKATSESIGTPIQLGFRISAAEGSRVRVVCLKCPFSAADEAGLLAHAGHHDPKMEGVTMKCQLCGFGALSSDELAPHLQIHVELMNRPGGVGAVNSAQGADGTAPADGEEDTNSKSSSSGNRPRHVYKCPHCPLFDELYSRVWNHLQRHRHRQKYVCTHCSFSAGAKNIVNEHILLHMRAAIDGDGGLQGCTVTVLNDSQQQHNNQQHQANLDQDIAKLMADQKTTEQQPKSDERPSSSTSTSNHSTSNIDPEMPLLQPNADVETGADGATGGGAPPQLAPQQEPSPPGTRFLQFGVLKVNASRAAELMRMPHALRESILSKAYRVRLERRRKRRLAEMESENGGGGNHKLPEADDNGRGGGGDDDDDDDEDEQLGEVKTDGDLKCAHCPFRDPDELVFALHSELHGGQPRPHACCLCSYSCFSAEALHWHLSLHLPAAKNTAAHRRVQLTRRRAHGSATPIEPIPAGAKVLRCPQCSFRTVSRDTLHGHRMDHARQLQQRLTTSIKRAKAAQREEEDGSGGVAGGTAKGGSSRPRLQKSVSKGFDCSAGCSFRCDSWTALARHTEAHGLNEAPFRCSLCDYGATAYQTLAFHETNHHAQRPLTHLLKDACVLPGSNKLSMRDAMMDNDASRSSSSPPSDELVARQTARLVGQHLACTNCDWTGTELQALAKHFEQTHTNGTSATATDDAAASAAVVVVDEEKQRQADELHLQLLPVVGIASNA